jgi:hypothetical protein
MMKIIKGGGLVFFTTENTEARQRGLIFFEE